MLYSYSETIHITQMGDIWPVLAQSRLLPVSALEGADSAVFLRRPHTLGPELGCDFKVPPPDLVCFLHAHTNTHDQCFTAAIVIL
jgi:hypothetical protein